MDESALFGIFDEVEDIGDFRSHGKLAADGSDGVSLRHTTLEDDAIGLVDGIDDLALEASTAQPYDVQTAVGGRVTRADGVGDDTLRRGCASAHHGISADAAELVDEYAGREDGMVVDGDFSGQFGGVSDDDIVANDDVVGDVTTFHKEVAAADYGLSFGGGATVDGDVLANLIIVTHDGQGLFAAELEILGDGADDGTGEDDVATADACAVEHGDAVHQGVVVANLYVLIDVAEGTDFYVLTYLGFGVNVCEGTDHFLLRVESF